MRGGRGVRRGGGDRGGGVTGGGTWQLQGEGQRKLPLIMKAWL